MRIMHCWQLQEVRQPLGRILLDFKLIVSVPLDFKFGRSRMFGDLNNYLQNSQTFFTRECARAFMLKCLADLRLQKSNLNILNMFACKIADTSEMLTRSCIDMERTFVFRRKHIFCHKHSFSWQCAHMKLTVSRKLMKRNLTSIAATDQVHPSNKVRHSNNQLSNFHPIDQVVVEI